MFRLTVANASLNESPSPSGKPSRASKAQGLKQNTSVPGSTNRMIFWLGGFCSHSIKLEKVGPTFSSFNPCPSMPSVVISDRKQFQCLNIVFNRKARLSLPTDVLWGSFVTHSFLPQWMRDKRTPKDVCGEAKLDYHFWNSIDARNVLAF